MKQGRCSIRKIVALCLAIVLIIPATVYANEADSITPYASYYLDSYNTYICDMGSGKIQIWFDVMGTGTMDELGTLRIMLYESSDSGKTWKWVKTYLHEDYASMLAYDDYYHCSYVSYQGSSSKTYKAYVCIWAGKNGSGDTRYMCATE